MKLELFYSPNACSLVPFITLTEAKADFSVRVLNLRKGEHQTADYAAVNPSKKVPVLIVDGAPLTENVAIQLFIAEAFPAAHLLPTAPFQRAEAISLMAWCASGFHPHLSRLGATQRFTDEPAAHDGLKRVAAANVEAAIAVAEQKLAGRSYFFDGFTAPDAYFFWCFRRAKQLGVPVENYPNCQAHFARLNERPSVIKAQQFETDAAAKLAA